MSKNEALRRQLHEVQLHCEQQLKAKDVAAQEEDRRRSQTYQKAMDEAKQLNAELMVGPSPFSCCRILCHMVETKGWCRVLEQFCLHVSAGSQAHAACRPQDST